MYIELIGQPGVGKSTVHSRLITNDQYYGGVEEDGVKRYFIQNKQKRLIRVYSMLPDLIREFLDNELLYYRVADEAFIDFIESHPEFIALLSTCLDHVDRDSVNLVNHIRKTAERYQIGVDTVKSGEILCLDNSFALRAVSGLWRSREYSFPLEEYYRIVPTPDVLLYIEAPVELCLERQKDRGRITVKKEWLRNSPEAAQHQYQSACEELAECLSEHGTKIVHVENVGDLDDTIEEIKTSIKRARSQERRRS